MSAAVVGKILGLFISSGQSSKRVEQEKIQLDEKGIVGDKFYDKDQTRSILITSKESYDLALSHDIQMPFGSLGENLLIDYNPYHLGSGTRVQIGEVVLKISQNCTICNHLSSVDKKLPKLLKDDRGIFAEVIQPGIITKGDTLSLIGSLS